MLFFSGLLLFDEGINAFFVIKGNIVNLADVFGNFAQLFLVLFDFLRTEEGNIDALLAIGLTLLLSSFGDGFFEAIEHLNI